MQAAQHALLPMEDSPGSSGAASSWQLVVPPPAPRFDVESISDGDELCSPSPCYDSTVREPALSALSLCLAATPCVPAIQLTLSGGSARAQTCG